MLKFFELYSEPSDDSALQNILGIIRKVVKNSSSVHKAPYR
jgi:hypothetical protein